MDLGGGGGHIYIYIYIYTHPIYTTQVLMSTYQAASGAGAPGMAELEDGNLAAMLWGTVKGDIGFVEALKGALGFSNKSTVKICMYICI